MRECDMMREWMCVWYDTAGVVVTWACLVAVVLCVVLVTVYVIKEMFSKKKRY